MKTSIIISILFSFQISLAMNNPTQACEGYAKNLEAQGFPKGLVNHTLGPYSGGNSFKVWVEYATHKIQISAVTEACNKLSTQDVSQVVQDVSQTCNENCLRVAVRGRVDANYAQLIHAGTKEAKMEDHPEELAIKSCRQSCDFQGRLFRAYMSGFNRGEGQCSLDGDAAFTGN